MVCWDVILKRGRHLVPLKLWLWTRTSDLKCMHACVHTIFTLVIIYQFKNLRSQMYAHMCTYHIYFGRNLPIQEPQISNICTHVYIPYLLNIRQFFVFLPLKNWGLHYNFAQVIFYPGMYNIFSMCGVMYTNCSHVYVLFFVLWSVMSSTYWYAH